ncbi:MAG: glycosyltransferase [Candidatus Methanomethylicus sp.]|nr:glycosyltransferase [Candidatus Methanomethylicus sp.]
MFVINMKGELIDPPSICTKTVGVKHRYHKEVPQNMKDHPLVSIITPTYNHEKFIGRCIGSALAQTYPSWEQIIVDDGSTDGTSGIISSYEHGDRRIRHIQQEHQGIWRLSETYNKALGLAKGELVAILEGDDFWPSWKLEKQVSAFGGEAVVMSFGKAGVVDEQERLLYIKNEKSKWLWKSRQEEKLRRLLFNNYIPACTVLCKREKLLSIGGFRQMRDAPFVDYSTWLDLGLRGEIQAIDEVLGFWRTHGKQVSALMDVGVLNGHRRCSLDCFMRLPPELKGGLTVEELENKFHLAGISYTFHSGRLKLFRREWAAAWEDFGKILRKGNPTAQIRSLVGLVCVQTHTNLEWAAPLMREYPLEASNY